jgi:hypothetical protein
VRDKRGVRDERRKDEREEGQTEWERKGDTTHTQ